jgi:Domain of unknown function (DUF4412)
LGSFSRRSFARGPAEFRAAGHLYARIGIGSRLARRPSMMPLMRKRALGCIALVALTGLFGCNKLRSMVDKDQGAGGVTSSGDGLAILNGFEGEIGVVVKPGPKEQNAKPIPPLTLLVKDNKVRVDVPPGTDAAQSLGNKVYAVLNTPEKKLYAVLDDKKQVILVDLNKLGDQLKSFGAQAREQGTGAGGTPHAPPKVTKTGKMEKVAGFDCENWEVVDPEKGGKAVVCIADRGASWFHLPITGIPTEYAWAIELMDGKHFPLRFIGYEKDGTEGGRVEVTKLEKKPLAAQMFEIPAGYQVMNLEQMMQGLMMGAMRPGAMPPGGFMPPPGMTIPPHMPHMPPGAHPMPPAKPKHP